MAMVTSSPRTEEIRTILAILWNEGRTVEDVEVVLEDVSR
jgi:hypothetical protein